MNIFEFFTMFAVHVALVVFCLGYLAIWTVSRRYGKKTIAPHQLTEKSNLPFISVVVPTYNEEKIIASRLDSLLAAEYPADRMEVVVVDSSDDATPAILENYARKFPAIKVIHDSERRGLATALNQAFRACKGEIVVKSDSDLTLAQDTLMRAVSHFADPRVGAVTGRVYVANAGASREVTYRGLHDKIQLAESNLDSVFMAHTFSAYRRHLMKEYRQTEYGDETIQTLHIRKQGYRVVHDPDVKFYEDYPEDSGERLRQKIRRSEGLSRVILENMDVLFNKKYGRFGSYIFPSNFFMFILSPLLLVATLIVAAVDLAFFGKATYLDILILVALGAILAARKRPAVASVWTFLELQYAQFRALLNVTLFKRRDYKWKKIERVAPQL